MKLGVITKYKLGFNEYGIRIINLFPESVRWSNLQKKYLYFPTTYYIHWKGQVWFVEDYQINTLIYKRQMALKEGIACLNSAFQDDELIQMVCGRRQRKTKLKKLPCYVTLRKRDKLSTKTVKPSLTQFIKRTGLHHPTITIPFPSSQKPVYLDICTYNTMKYAYVKRMRKLGLDPTLVDEAIQARLDIGFKGTANNWLKQFAA